jgi:3-methyladenine DNA glycosylase Mpg
LACELVAGGVPLRVVEVERYPAADPFAHGHPLQRPADRWYFHRVGAGYRGGSFKGLDVTAGDGVNPEGLLLRAVEHPDGSRTDGPSRLVDRLLRLTGCETVAALDARLGSVWDETAPVFLRRVGPPARVVRSARVGLGLKRFRPEPGHPAVQWLAAPERYLADPRRSRTGRVQLAVAGLVTGPERWQRWFADGGDPADWYGRALSTEGLCRLLGWAAVSSSA